MRFPFPTLLGLTVLVFGCSRQADIVPSFRLVDHIGEAQIEGTPPASDPPPPIEWMFEKGHLQGWQVTQGIRGLAVRNGRLAGRTTSAFPVLHLERQDTGEPDELHAVEIRLRSTAGANLSIGFSGKEEPEMEPTLGYLDLFPWSKTPIVAGPELLGYRLTGPFPAQINDTRHIFLRPTDVAGANFEIESIRLVTRREHLAEFPSGVGWQGLGEIYRESIVARAPERVEFHLELPPDPFFEVALGSPQDDPLTFRIGVRELETSSQPLVVERTITTSGRWEPVQLDLADQAGRQVSLSLELEAEDSGTIGFWGTPAIRSRGAMPKPTRWRGPGDPIEAPQGVILIMVDTLRADHLDAYGYERATAPNLTQLAAEGAKFSDAVAQATWTKVSSTSILTSLYPSSHGVAEFPDRLPASAVTMADVFREAGYATISFSSVFFTGKFTNLHQGFEVLHESTSVGSDSSAKTARVYTDRLLPWLERHRDVPFFVFFHLFDPHDPYEPYRPYDSMWFDPAARSKHEADMEKVRSDIGDPLRRAFGMPYEDELVSAGLDPEIYNQRQIDWYDGSIRGFDAELERLRERLRELDLEEKTLIVFVSDHGEEFLDHRMSFHGQSVYGELTDVPLIFSFPGAIPQGLVIPHTVQTLDILPTVLELTRLSPPDGLQGQSLVPYLLVGEGGRLKPRPAISEQRPISAGGGNPTPANTESLAIVWDGWKLIHNREGRGEKPEFELYDHQNDPLDQLDVAAQNPEIVKDLGRILEARHKEALAARLEEDAEGTEAMSPEELERLRALGYIQ